MAAVWMRLRAEARARWRAWLSLALIFGLGAGAAIGAIAGARRTNSAYPRFVAAQDAIDAVTGGGDETRFKQNLEALKRHPMVEDYVELIIIGGEITVPAKPGRAKIVTRFPDLLLTTDPGGRMLYETNRAKVLEGRLPDRRRADETMVSLIVAERYGVDVGDRIVAGVGFDFENFPAPIERVPLRVVGIYAAPGEFEALGQSVFFAIPATPALFEKYRHLLPPPAPDFWSLGLHLRGGVEAGPLFKQIVERDFNLDVPIIESTTRVGVQKTMRLYAVALWLVGSLIAAATVAIVGQTLARQQLLESSEYPALRAMGLTRRQLLALGLWRVTIVGTVAALLAGVIAYVLSPLTPIGPARAAEPYPGLAFDAVAIGLGVGAILLLVPLVTAIPSFRAARVASRPEDAAPGSGRSAAVARALGSLSASPATAAGVRMALEPGRGPTSVPVRSTILAVALGIAAVIASVTVGRSLSHLIQTPSLTGFTYDAILPGDDQHAELTDEQRQALMRSFPFVDRAVKGALINVVFGGVDSFLLGFEDAGDIGYAVIDGRAPRDVPTTQPPEIALGPSTMRRLDVRIGDTIEFGYPDPRQGEEEETGQPTEAGPAKVRARIVGVAAIPAFPFAVIEPGEGAIMSAVAIDRFSPSQPSGCCFVAFKEGTDLAAAREELAAGGFDQVFLRTKRSDLATLEKISRLPVLLSAIFASIAAAALAHVLVTAVRRRRRDLAILKTLGFVKRQVRGAIAWQVSAITVLSFVVGVPAGIALGRWGWRLIAAQFGVVPVAVLPAALLALVLPAGLVLGNLVAALPGRSAAGTQPAFVLRTE